MLAKKILVGAVFILLHFLVVVHCQEEEEKKGENEEEEEDEYKGAVPWERNETFCTGLRHLKDRTWRRIDEAGEEIRYVRRVCPEFKESNLLFFFSLFMIIAYGALVRTILRMTKLNMPYTVILMISGLLLGLGTRIPGYLPFKELKDFQNEEDDLKMSFCSFWSVYTKIARIPPKIILYTFLPVLIFESAFNMKVHVFLKSASQILIVALPGMLITTFITACVCQQFMHSYDWSFTQSSLFGSIISATDPVAVVAILRELGTSDTLSTIIEGESLLNDGVAILLYEIFLEIVEMDAAPEEHSGGNDLITGIVLKFMSISLGGPFLGWCFGKLSIYCLNLIFNDAAVEITITLVSAYLTYYIGEALGVSGVVAVVVLGITMNAESTSISPEAEALVHHFWEMLGYLANTVLFVVVGILITETAVNQIDATDGFYLAFFYVAINIVRLLMLMLLMPWLSRIGYGLKWKDMLTMMWGGLRGAVGLCLALEVYRNEKICEIDDDKLAPKFLFHTAGIVILTLVINGTTTKALLTGLGMTIISPGRYQDMSNAVKQIVGAQVRTVAVLKHDRFLADANWDVVEKYTAISNPYKKDTEKTKDGRKATTGVNSMITIMLEEDQMRDAQGFDMNEPTAEDFRIMTEEARLRLLKALKVSFWRQYEQGVLTDIATQILIGVAESTADKELHMIHARDFKYYFNIHGVFNWIRINIIKKLGLDAPAVLPPKPRRRWRHPFWFITTRDWFDGIMHLVVLLNMIPVIWETVFVLKPNPEYNELDNIRDNNPEDLSDEQAERLAQIDEGVRKRIIIFLAVNCVFTLIYLIEFFLKIIGLGCREYWSKKWNWLDVIILFVSLIDITITAIQLGTSNASGKSQIAAIRITVQVFRIGRISRSLRLFRPLLPRIYRLIDSRINATLFLGYDVGKGFVTAVEDVLKFLPQIVEHPRILHKLKLSLEHERLETVRQMGLLQDSHHRISIAVKTRHASRAVLNQMREALAELKEDGLLDDKESSILMSLLEEKMKRLWGAPASIHPSAPEVLLLNVAWLFGNEDLGKFISRRAILLNFGKGDAIYKSGENPTGIFVIISGMVKVHFKPSEEILKDLRNFGILPNVEVFSDLAFETEETEYFSTGTVLGELGMLTGTKEGNSVICETEVIAYHINMKVLDEAMRQFNEKNDSLEARLWRSVGMQLSAALLPSQAVFQSWTLDKIRMHLERSAVPVGDKFDTMTVPDFIANVILIYGQIQDAHTHDIYTAPCLLPHTCTKITMVTGAPVKGRILIVAHEEIDHEDIGSNTSLHRQVVNTPNQRKDLMSAGTGSDGKPSNLSLRNRRVSEAINFGVRERRKSKANQLNTGNN